MGVYTGHYAIRRSVFKPHLVMRTLTVEKDGPHSRLEEAIDDMKSVCFSETRCLQVMTMSRKS
jgi:hypothetical protein